MKVLLDTDVIIDFFLNRQPFAREALILWQANRSGQFEGYISAITPVNLYYIGRKTLGAIQARQAIEDLLTEFRVCPINHNILEAAHLSAIADFEDAVQHVSAVIGGLNAIVTRNLKDYINATLPLFSPSDYAAQLSVK